MPSTTYLRKLTLLAGLFLATLLASAISATGTDRTAELRRALLDRDSQHVFVIAHRGDWRNAPENSLDALKKCIDLGVDIVEMDLARTKDGELVVIHDRTLDRTTTGKGKVSDFTLAEIRALYLRNGAGHKTAHRVPTLREFMMASKGRILVNLDKTWDYWSQAREILAETGTLEEVIMKAWLPEPKFRSMIKDDQGRVIFMPVIDLRAQGGVEQINEYLAVQAMPAFELIFDDDRQFTRAPLSMIRETGGRIWVNSLWPELCGGHDDDQAETKPEECYGWLIANGTTMIATDRPEMLIEYLTKKGRRKIAK